MITRIQHENLKITLQSLRTRGFRSVFSEGKRFVHPALVLIVQYRQQRQPSPSVSVSFGVGVRRGAPAVTRNRIKRLLRESLRRYFREHPEKAKFFDAVILIWRTLPNRARQLRFESVYTTVKQLLEQAVQQYADQASA